MRYAVRLALAQVALESDKLNTRDWNNGNYQLGWSNGSKAWATASAAVIGSARSGLVEALGFAPMRSRLKKPVANPAVIFRAHIIFFLRRHLNKL